MRFLCLFSLFLALAEFSLFAGDMPDVPEWRSYGRTVKLKEPILVRRGERFSGDLGNGKWTRFVADSKRMGDGSQREGQQPLFILEPGARIERVIIDHSAADGIHVRTADGFITTVRKVQFRDVGEDAITVVSGDNDGHVLIDECMFQDASDKVIQINAPARVWIEDCYARNFQRFCRTSGTGGDSRYRVRIFNLFAQNGDCILRMTNGRAEGSVMHSYFEDVRVLVEAHEGAECRVEENENDDVGLIRRLFRN